MKLLLGVVTTSLALAVVVLLAIPDGPARADGPAEAASDQKGESKAQTVCPITGDPISKKHHVDAEGKRIYLCCPACKAKVKENPGKIIDKLEKKGVELEDAPAAEGAKDGSAEADKAQTTCPVLGGPINKKHHVDHQGKRIYACCAGCVAKMKKNPEKYIEKLEARGVTLEAVPAESADEDGAAAPPHRHRHGKRQAHRRGRGKAAAGKGGCCGRCSIAPAEDADSTTDGEKAAAGTPAEG
jgi:YHS domain-containing protein